MKKSPKMRRFRGRKFRSEKRKSEKTSSNFLVRNMAIRCACYRLVESPARSTATRWSSAAERMSDRQARSVHFGSSKKRRSRPERGASKQSLVTQHARGRKRKVHVNRRSLKRLRAGNPSSRHYLLLKRKRKPLKC